MNKVRGQRSEVRGQSVCRPILPNLKSAIRNPQSNRGVAIILVLGLLAVLMLTAVAFSISMRIERSGASNFRHGVQARHMLWSALANAVEEINEVLDGANGFYIYPDWNVLSSSSNGNFSPREARVLSRTAIEFVPGSLINEVEAATNYWRAINIGGQTRGRYAWLAVNCSGLLDASKVGRMDRTNGTSSYEIQVDNLITDETLFRNYCARDVRYETLPEFKQLNSALKSPVNDFAGYSLAKISERMVSASVVTQKVYIGADTNLWNAAQIKQAFANSGVSDFNLAYSNLLDYVDSNSVPLNLAAPCAEAVPMINEAVLHYNGTLGAGGTYNFTCGVEIEWFYPFSVASAESFKLLFDATFSANAGNTYADLVPLAMTNNQSVLPPCASPSYGSFDVDKPKNGSLGTNDPVNIKFTAEIKAQIQLADGTIVDAVPWPYSGDGLKIEVDITKSLGESFDVEEWIECIDPRFNWDPGNIERWWLSKGLRDVQLDYPDFTPASSIGAGNSLVKYLFTHPAALDNVLVKNFDDNSLDNAKQQFVVNRSLQSVGELGYLCLKDWYSIRLYDHNDAKTYLGEATDYHRVLDYFTVHTNTYARGLVNINTTNRNVLASVFYDCPEMEYQAGPRISWVNATNIAGQIIATGLYTNLSDLGSVVYWPSYVSGSSEIAKEGPIRNSADLLTVRHNLFTIIFTADSFSEAMGGAKGGAGKTLASAHAVAELWRDPFRDRDGKHQWFIRYFKILED